MTGQSGVVYEFGPFRLDLGERLLLRDSHPVQLRAKVFDTLRVLVEDCGHLLPKDELLKAVWPDSIVEENNLAHNITVLRKTLGEKKYVETVPGKGYRFIAEVKTLKKPEAQETERPVNASISPWQTQLAAARAEFASEAEDGKPVATGGSRHNVGRSRELAALLAGFEAAVGRGLLFCVAGESGIGKTTLVEQFLAELKGLRQSCTIAVGRCSQRLAGSEAYLPILEALEDLLAGPRGRALAQLMKLVAPTWYVQVAPLWAAADPSFAHVVADAKAASRERMKRELSAFLEEVSRVRPLVLFLDDLHWADVSTVELLAYLSKKFQSLRLLTLVAYRQAEMLLDKHPFVPVRQELQKQGVCRELVLEFLTREDVDSYLSLEFGDHKLPGEFADFVYRRTDGSPLFMADLVRHLRDHGVLTEAPGRWELAKPLASIEQELPESVRSMIQRRIDQLSDDDRELLAVAGVQGQEFDSAVLACVLGIDAVRVEERLRLLDRVHGWVRFLHEKEFPDSTVSQRYAFVHVLYQNAIYDTLAPSSKVGLSSRVAEALAGCYGEKAPQVALELALLYETARDFERAADHFLLAARNASHLYANEEAVLLSRRAMTNAEKLEGEARLVRVFAAANRLGRLHLTLSRIEEAVADFKLAETAAAEMGDVKAEVNAICAAALALFNLKRMEATRQYAGRALKIAQAASSEVAVASAELVLGLERLCFGATDEAERSFGQAVPVLRQKGPPLHALEAIGFAGLLHAWQLDYGEAEHAVAWTLQRARDVGVPYHIILNLFVRGMALFNQGRLSEGLNDLQEGMRLAELNNERYWLSRYPNTLGWVYRELQDIETALKLDADGAKIARENGYAKAEANSHVNLAHNYLQVGELNRTLEHIEAAEKLFEEDVWFRWRYNIRLKAEMARYWMRRGDTKNAACYASQSLSLAEPRRARKHMAWAHKLLGDIAVMEERFADGRRDYEAALRVLERHHCPTIEWQILLAAADMASCYRDVSLAERYRARCQKVIRLLADSITSEKLRRQFLNSEAIRAALI